MSDTISPEERLALSVGSIVAATVIGIMLVAATLAGVNVGPFVGGSIGGLIGLEAYSLYTLAKDVNGDSDV